MPPDTVERIRAAAPRLRRWADALGVPLGHLDFVQHATAALRPLGRQDAVLELFPEIDEACAPALVDMGRFDEALARPGCGWVPRITSLLMQGRLDEAILLNGGDALTRDCYLARDGAQGALERWVNDSTLLQLAGRFDEALAMAREPVQRALVLRDMGRMDEALAAAPVQWLRNDILIRQGRYTEGMTHLDDDRGRAYVCILTMLERGDEEPAKELLARALRRDPPLWPYDGAALVRLFLPLLLANRAGEHIDVEAALRPVLEEHRWLEHQRPWHIAAYVVGRIDDEAFLRQPLRLHVEERLLFARGLRHELARRWADAAACYAEALPRVRLGSAFGAGELTYARWRLKDLKVRER